MTKTLTTIKFLTIVAFAVTLCATYYLRSEVLKLNKIRFSAENIRAEESMKTMKESYPARVTEYEIQMKNYDLQKEHFEEMVKLYRSNYEEYARRLKDEYKPPQLPFNPRKPRSPELSEQLAQIDADFRAQQYHYFDSTGRLNWVCCVSAILLVSGLLFLIMFEIGGQRILYLVVLILSFVFMIGPSFHSILSAIVGFLRAPSIY